MLGTWCGISKHFFVSQLPFPQNKNEEALTGAARWPLSYVTNAQRYSLTRAASVMLIPVHCDFKNAWGTL